MAVYRAEQHGLCTATRNFRASRPTDCVCTARSLLLTRGGAAVAASLSTQGLLLSDMAPPLTSWSGDVTDGVAEPHGWALSGQNASLYNGMMNPWSKMVVHGAICEGNSGLSSLVAASDFVVLRLKSFWSSASWLAILHRVPGRVECGLLRCLGVLSRPQLRHVLCCMCGLLRLPIHGDDRRLAPFLFQGLGSHKHKFCEQ